MGENRDVTGFTERGWFATRVVNTNVMMCQKPFDTAPHHAVAYQPHRHDVSPSLILIGRHPPCCGGVPPRPFTLIAAAAAPVMMRAAMILRRNFT